MDQSTLRKSSNYSTVRAIEAKREVFIERLQSIWSDFKVIDQKVGRYERVLIAPCLGKKGDFQNSIIRIVLNSVIKYLIDYNRNISLDIINLPTNFTPKFREDRVNIIDLDSLQRVRLTSSYVPYGVEVPEILLKPVLLVTISNVQADLDLRFSSLLSGKLPLITRDLKKAQIYKYALLYETYRLLHVDLCIACGQLSLSNRAFCIVSNDELAVEATVVRLLGLPLKRYPIFKYFSKRETIDFDIVNYKGDLLKLNNIAVPLWKNLSARIFYYLLRYIYRFISECHTIIANLDRVIDYIFRKLKATLRIS